MTPFSMQSAVEALPPDSCFQKAVVGKRSCYFLSLGTVPIALLVVLKHTAKYRRGDNRQVPRGCQYGI